MIMRLSAPKCEPMGTALRNPDGDLQHRIGSMPSLHMFGPALSLSFFVDDLGGKLKSGVELRCVSVCHSSAVFLKSSENSRSHEENSRSLARS